MFASTSTKYSIESALFATRVTSSHSKVWKDPEKVKAITNMLPPASLADLRRLMGILAYIMRFVKKLEEYTELLRPFLKKNLFNGNQPIQLLWTRSKSLSQTCLF